MAQATASAVRWRTPSEIEAEAARLREEYGVEVPVDPFVLADRMGVTVYRVTFPKGAVAGALRRRDGKAEILVRTADPVARQVFTLAHELGHYVLHWPAASGPDQGPDTFVDTDLQLYRHGPAEAGPEADRDRRKREVQANMFAAALLMPEPDVRLEWERTKSLKELARVFEVSQEAMRYRIAQLEIW